MLHCDTCGTDLVDGACPSGHGPSDPSIVVPAGHAGSYAVETPEAEPAAQGRVISIGGPYRGPGSILSEALSALADADVPATEVTSPAADEPESIEPESIEPELSAPVADEPEQPTAAEQLEVGYDDEPLSFDLGVVEAAEPDAPEAPNPASDAPAPVISPVGVVGGDLIGKPVGERRARSLRPLVALPLILALLGGAGAFFVFGASGTANAAVYRRAFIPKESHTYRFSMSMKGTVDAGPATEQLDMTMKMTVTERTLGVDPEGVATLEQSIDAAEVSVNGQRAPMAELSGVTITVRMAPDGRVLAVEGLGALGLSDAGPIGEFMGPNTIGPLLPSDAVAPGDTWTVQQDVPTPLVDDPLTMTARNRLVERRADGGQETALIRSELTMPMNLEIPMRKLLALAEESAGERVPDMGIPKGAVFVYAGGMTMDLVQLVEVPSSRPIRITGDGSADLRMKIEGIGGGMPEMRMRLTMTMSMVEVEASARATASAFAPDPVLSA